MFGSSAMGYMQNIPEEKSYQISLHPPPVDTNPGTEAFFAAELTHLSTSERDEVLHDIHGISNVECEDKTFVQRCFDDLDEAIALIPTTEKMSYLLAMDLDGQYVSNEKFMLMFLRAASFDVKAAAARMVSFFDMKLGLFGVEKLCKDISYDDLDKYDIQCLESGYAQILTGRDRAGRAILFLMPVIRKYRTLQNRLRATYMVLMHCLRDQETQKSGLVGIAYNVGAGYTSDREAVWRMAQLVATIPTKFRGMHYCYENRNAKMLFSIAMYVWEKQTRIRCRLHCGTHMECIYNLMTFGISSEILPIAPSGDRRMDAFQDYCKKLAKYSKLDGTVQRIVVPSLNDILLGRGKPLQKHPGNIRFHHILDGYNEQYESEHKLGKTRLSKELVQKFKEEGCRFMKQDEGGWVEVDDEAARYKVSHTFRNHRIAARAQDKKQSEKGQGRKLKDDENAEDPECVDESINGEGNKRRRLSEMSSSTSSMN